MIQSYEAPSLGSSAPSLGSSAPSLRSSAPSLRAGSEPKELARSLKAVFQSSHEATRSSLRVHA